MNRTMSIRGASWMKRAFAVFLVAALVFTLSACGKKAEPKEEVSEELVIGLAGTLAALGTNQEAGALNYYVSSLCQEGLVSLSNEGEIEPALAESYEDEDATVWTFKLRDDAKFQDGSPVTVDDVIYSIELARDPERSPGVSIYYPTYVKEVKKLSDSELQITLDGSHPSFIWSVSNTGGLFVTKKEFAEKAGAIGSSKDLILGSGPYKAKEFKPGSYAIFEGVDTWWAGKPTYKTLRFEFIEDDNTRQAAFADGKIDFALNVTVDLVSQYEEAGATIDYISDRSYYGLTFDPTVAPFDDEHVRKTFAYAVDKKGIVDNVLKGHATVATAIPSPQQFATVYSEAEAKKKLDDVKHYSYSIEKAKEELALSKVPSGFETTVYYPDSYKSVGDASLVIAEALKEIGITLNVKQIPLDQWLSEVGNGSQGVAWMIYLPTTAEPGEITSWLLDAQGPGSNPANWENKEVAELTDKVGAAKSFKASVKPLIDSMNIAQELAIYSPVYWGQSPNALSKDLTLESFNSYTLLSPNWPQYFKKS